MQQAWPGPPFQRNIRHARPQSCWLGICKAVDRVSGLGLALGLRPCLPFQHNSIHARRPTRQQFRWPGNTMLHCTSCRSFCIVINNLLPRTAHGYNCVRTIQRYCCAGMFSNPELRTLQTQLWDSVKSPALEFCWQQHGNRKHRTFWFA